MPGDVHNAPLLSLCIATRNRAHLLPETLASLRPQLSDDIELVFVDGGSTDATKSVVRDFAAEGHSVQYHYHDDRAGLDRDYDRAVEYASGRFCWLLTDDDLIDADGIASVRNLLDSDTNLLVLNSRVASADFHLQLQDTRMPDDVDDAGINNTDDLFLRQLGDTLSFIGAVVIRRQLWLSRDRESFYGCMFVHVGVILQHPPIDGVKVRVKPIMTLRYGNASWSSRTFEIWSVLWPQLIWQFDAYSPVAKAAVIAEYPYLSALYLLKQRARGAYGLSHYRAQVAPRTAGLSRFMAWLVAACPGSVVNVLAVIYVGLLGGGGKLGLYDLQNSPHANRVSLWVMSRVRP
ncbi:MAG: glycosyltransferase family 2 protein [Congregibacter sp.]